MLGKNQLATRNSPITITELGKNANQTGLSIESISQILEFIDNYTPTKPPRVNTLIQLQGWSWYPSAAAIFENLMQLWEIQTEWLRASSRGPNPINKSNTKYLLWMWISGWSYQSILWFLKYRKDEKQSEWRWPLKNDERSLEIEGELLALRRFCDNWFTYSWNWILTGLQLLITIREVDIQPDPNIDKVKQYIRYGVDNELAVDMLILADKHGFPGTRDHAQILSVWVHKVDEEINSLYALVSAGIVPTQSDLDSIILDHNSARLTNLEPDMRDRIINWLEDLEPETFDRSDILQV
jgi:hypothetical protein